MTPEAPTNVRVIMRDGSEIACEMRYRGWVDGKHEWVATAHLRELPVSITADRIPADTAIVVEGDFPVTVRVTYEVLGDDLEDLTNKAMSMLRQFQGGRMVTDEWVFSIEAEAEIISVEGAVTLWRADVTATRPRTFHP